MSIRDESGYDGLRQFRWVLGLLVFLLIYDGAIRKWLLPGAEQLVFIAKDVLLLGALGLWIAMRTKARPARLHPIVRLTFTLYACWVVIRVFSLHTPNMLVGLWGLKSHLLYASVLVFIPLAFARLEKLFQVLEDIYPFMVVPVCGLAFLQVMSPAGSLLNLQLDRGFDSTAYFGEEGLVRVTGTFSYIAGMAAFIQCTSLLGIVLYLGGARSKRFLIGLGFAMAALPVTGSRSVVAVVMVGAALVLFAGLSARVISLRTVVKAAASLAGLVVVSLYAQEAAWNAFLQRVIDNPQDQSRAVTGFTNAFQYMEVAGLAGFGTGAANYGAPALAKDVLPFSWLPVGGGFEDESGRIVLEIGILGWALSLAMRISLLIWAVSLLRKGKTPATRLAAVLGLPVMGLGALQGNGVFAVPVAAVFYWFCVALMAMAHYQNLDISASLPQSRQMARKPGVAP